MPKYNVTVEFWDVEGADMKNAVDRLSAALYHMYPVSAVDTDIDWDMLEAVEVMEGEDAERS